MTTLSAVIAKLASMPRLPAPDSVEADNDEEVPNILQKVIEVLREAEQDIKRILGKAEAVQALARSKGFG